MNTREYIKRACQLRSLRERLEEYQMPDEAPFIRAEISRLLELQEKERASQQRRERYLREKNERMFRKSRENQTRARRVAVAVECTRQRIEEE